MKPFRVAHVEFMRQAHGRGTAGIRYGNHDIDIFSAHDALDLLRQSPSHTQARLVYEDVIDNRVGSCEIDKLEDTGTVLGTVGALTGMQFAIMGEYDRLTGLDVTHAIKIQRIQGYTFRCGHHLRPLIGIAYPENQRSNAIGVTKRNHPITRDHGNRGIATTAAAMDTRNRTKHIVLVQ